MGKRNISACQNRKLERLFAHVYTVTIEIKGSGLGWGIYGAPIWLGIGNFN